MSKNTRSNELNQQSSSVPLGFGNGSVGISSSRGQNGYDNGIDGRVVGASNGLGGGINQSQCIELNEQSSSVPFKVGVGRSSSRGRGLLFSGPNGRVVEASNGLAGGFNQGQSVLCVGRGIPTIPMISDDTEVEISSSRNSRFHPSSLNFSIIRSVRRMNSTPNQFENADSSSSDSDETDNDDDEIFIDNDEDATDTSTTIGGDEEVKSVEENSIKASVIFSGGGNNNNNNTKRCPNFSECGHRGNSRSKKAHSHRTINSCPLKKQVEHPSKIRESRKRRIANVKKEVAEDEETSKIEKEQENEVNQDHKGLIFPTNPPSPTSPPSSDAKKLFLRPHTTNLTIKPIEPYTKTKKAYSKLISSLVGNVTNVVDKVASNVKQNSPKLKEKFTRFFAPSQTSSGIIDNVRSLAEKYKINLDATSPSIDTSSAALLNGSICNSENDEDKPQQQSFVSVSLEDPKCPNFKTCKGQSSVSGQSMHNEIQNCPYNGLLSNLNNDFGYDSDDITKMRSYLQQAHNQMNQADLICIRPPTFESAAPVQIENESSRLANRNDRSRSRSRSRSSSPIRLGSKLMSRRDKESNSNQKQMQMQYI